MRLRNSLIAAARLTALAPVLALLMGAISASMTWEVRTGGSDTANGGGFRGGAYVAAPSAPTVNGSGTGGTVAAGTYYCVVTYTDFFGDSVISGETSVTTTGTTSSITVTSPPSLTNATKWNCYFATATGGPYFPQGTALTIGSNRVVTTTPPTTGTQPLGVNRAIQNSAQVTIDNAAITATTAGAASNVITFTGYTPTGADVGNVFRATGGTNITTGVYEITAITSTTWTVTGAANLTTAGGAGSAITGVMGGAFATPGQAGSVCTGSHVIYVKYSATPYTISASSNVAGGTLNSSGNPHWTGYDTTRTPYNSDANRPILKANANTMTVVTLGQNDTSIANFSINNADAHTSVRGMSLAARSMAILCDVDGMNNDGVNLASAQAIVDRLSVTGTSGGYGIKAQSSSKVYRCYVSGGSGTGGINLAASFNDTGLLQDSIVRNQSGSGPGITSSGMAIVNNCTADNITGSSSTSVGFSIGTQPGIYTNLIATNCAAQGFFLSGSNNEAFYSNLAGYNNTNGNISSTSSNAAMVQNLIALTADPFVNSSGGNYALNATSGGGALCRGAGMPGVMPGGLTTGYRSLGAVEPNSAGSTGGFRPRPRTSFNLLPEGRPASPPGIMPGSSDREWRKAG